MSRKQVVAGFDGFTDSIQKVVYNYPENQPTEYFKTIEEFGHYITAKKTGGLSLETEEVFKKLGGNVPIMANALAQFGLRAHCIGAFGYPQIDPVFSSMHPGTCLYSFANPGITSALEFNDGKIMLAQMSGLNEADWDLIKNYIGLEKIIRIVEGSDMMCLLNWSEVRHTNEIWEGLLHEVFPSVSRINRMKVFFDLSDCSKHSSAQIRKALELIQQFSVSCDVTLSLNANEASLVYQSIHASSCDDPEKTGDSISPFLNVETLVIHTSARSWAWSDSVRYQSDTFPLKNSMISTGAGDNFNAGFCIGTLLELETEESLMLANLLAASYMKYGRSPALPELLSFIDEGLI